MISPFPSLSERQRACLRLVRDMRKSKEIARELGLSSHTVDSYISEAIEKLGASDRYHAARLLAEHEAPLPPQSFIPDLSRVEHTIDPGPTLAPQTWDSSETGDEAILARPIGLMSRPASHPFPLPVPTQRRPLNDLSARSRIGWIIAIAIGSLLAFGSLLNAFDVLSRIL